jgi:uncharacterized protein (DUF1697 family)
VPRVTRYVALLRAINLGARRRVPMPRLREVLAERGHGTVRTHLASGNVLLDSPLPEAELARELGTAIEAEFGFEVPVVLRTAEELDGVVARDPFGDVATDPSRYSVSFFPEPLPADLVAALPEPSTGARLVEGREVYLWMPEGFQAGSAGRGPEDRALGSTGTNRNWRTVTALARLARE